MRPPLRVSVLTGLLAAAVLLAPPRALACSCTNNHTVMEEYDAASTLFAGTVTNIQPAGDGLNYMVTLNPTIRWKGGLDSPAQVLTGLNDGVCGFHFVVGEDYLVFAFNTLFNGQPALFTHSCSMDGLLAGNTIVPQLPPPVQPVPTLGRSWGTLKTLYR